jgi:oxygen-independent coproporphyrinogen-3 oxidase
MESLAAGRLPIGGEEQIDGRDGKLEALLLGLRVNGGIPDTWIQPEIAEDLVGRGLARFRGSRFALTDRGMLLASEVVLAVEAGSARDR